MMLASFLAVLGGWLGFANPVYRLPLLALLLPAGLAAAAVRAPTPRRAARVGYGIGTLVAVGNLYWTVLPVHDYGGLAWPLALPVPVLVGLVLGLYTAGLAVLLRFAHARLSPWLFGPFAGLAWATMEMARGYFFTGFPWLVLPAALSPWPAAIQGAAFLGVYGLAGLCAWLATWLAVPGPLTRQALAAVAIGATLFFLGNRRLASPAPSQEAVNATIIQGNVDQSRKWDPAAQRETVDEYLTLSRQAIKNAPIGLLVWPETAMPFFYQTHGPLARRLIDFTAETGVPVVFGAPAFQGGGEDKSLLNRAYLLAPSGREAFYDKEHLVPFGEYVPLGKYLPFIHKLVEGVGDFKPGRAEEPLRSGHLALGLLICYEAIFPELAQQRVQAGANLLVNISNDAWFGDSAAPRQHLDLALLRAVEQERAIIRGTNSGISAVIDPRGRVMAQGGLFTTLILPCPEVPLVSETTWFHRHYALVTRGIPILLALLFAVCLVAPSRPGRD